MTKAEWSPLRGHMPRARSEYNKDHHGPRYSVDTYISYAKSIGLAIERRCKDYPPHRPADFSRICRQEVDRALQRLRTVSGTISQMSLNRSQQKPDI